MTPASSPPEPAFERDSSSGSTTDAPARLTPADVDHTPRGFLLLLGLANLGICIAVITPVLASMTYKLQHINAAPGAATTQLGIILGIGAFFALIANPVVGRLSDRTTWRFGMRRGWIAGGSAVGFASLVGIGLSTSPVVVGILWCVAQASLNASLAGVSATVADQVPVAHRGRASGIIGITIPLSIVSGSALVSVLPTDLLRFGLPGAIAVLLTSLFALFLRDRVLTSAPAEPLRAKQVLGAFALNPRKHPDFGWTWLSKFMVMFGYAGIATFFPMFLGDKFALGETQALQVVALSNLILTVATLVASPVAGWMSDKLERRRVFVALASTIMVVGLVILAFAPSLTVVYIAQAIIGIGTGSFTAVDLALGTQVLPNPEDTAKDLGLLTAANSLPQSIAPALAPAIIGIGSLTTVGGYSAWYLFGAAIALAGAISVYRVKSVR